MNDGLVESDTTFLAVFCACISRSSSIGPKCSAFVGQVATQCGFYPSSIFTPLPRHASHLSMPASVYSGTPKGHAKKQ